MSETARKILAAAIALGAVAIAVVFWPRGPLELGDEWLVDTACEPSADGIRFTGHLDIPVGAPGDDPLDGLSHIVVEVRAHEGGRQVGTGSVVHDLRPQSTTTAELVSLPGGAHRLASVDLTLPVGAVKSPTCAATVTGHR